MKRAVALLCLVAAACALASGATGTSSKTRISHRVYRMTWRGSLELGYSAYDNTPFDIQRAGYTGCAYNQQGDTLVAWKDVWQMHATVKSVRHFSHMSHIRFNRLSGPVDPHADSSSQIQGSNRNGTGNTECSDAGQAGAFNCTAESVRPLTQPKSQVSVDPDHPSTLDFQMFGFLTASAAYTGQQPSSQWTCAADIGKNSDPGGFALLDGSLSAALMKVTAKDLIALKKHKTYKDDSTTLKDDPAWTFDLPTSCAVGDDEVCTFTDAQTNRGAELTFKRVR